MPRAVQDVAPGASRAQLLLYDLALCLGLVVTAPWLLFRVATRRRWREGLAERLTLRLPKPPAPGARRLWVHAASAGEMNAALALVAALRARRPDLDVVLSSVTTSGVDVARRRMPEFASFVAPLDLGPLVRRALRRVAPAALVLVELELWPNLVAAAAGRGLPVAVANGRIGARTARRWRWPLARRLVGVANVCVFAVQDEEHRRRLLSLGVAEERIVVTGNVKVDEARPARLDRAAARRRLGLPTGEPVFFAGSTHAGEETAAAAAARAAGARLVVAPRHAERLDQALRDLAAAGFAARRLSEPAANADAPGVAVVVDTMGELADLYAAADLAFVGGSLFPGVGGHNVFEPALAGVPALVGRHHGNVRSDVLHLAGAGALEVVDGAAELAAAARRLLGDDGERRRMIVAAKRALDEARGAAERTRNIIEARCLS